MILRRISEQVKAQNWFAISVELVILVLGVFIGIQVSNWNDERREKAQEANLLVQMHDAFVDDVATVVDSQRQEAEAIEAIKYILRAIRDGEEPEDRRAFLEALSKARSAPNIIFEAPLATVLFSSGGLTELSSPDLRQAVVNYRNTVTVLQQLASDQRILLANLENGAESGIYLNPDFTSFNDMLYEYDFTEVAANRAFYQSLLRSTLAIQVIAQQLVAETETIIEEIESAQK
jgi:hypothetical protein